MLAYNFHESLNLQPLFLDLKKEISRDKDNPEQEELLSRLKRVAGEVVEKQTLVLEAAGQQSTEDVILTDLPEKPDIAGSIEVASPTLTCEKIKRRFTISALQADPQGKRVKLTNSRSDTLPEDDTPTGAPTQAEFWVGSMTYSRSSGNLRLSR